MSGAGWNNFPFGILAQHNGETAYPAISPLSPSERHRRIRRMEKTLSVPSYRAHNIAISPSRWYIEL